MRKTFLLPISAACLLMLGNTAFAQEAAKAQPQTQAPMGGYHNTKGPKLTPDQRLDKKVAIMNDIVKLSPDQQTQTRELLKAIYDEKQQNKVTANGDRDKLKSLNKETAKRKNAGLKKILSKEQLATLNAAKKQTHSEPIN